MNAHKQMILAWFIIVQLKTSTPIKFTILYEKQVENTVGETYRIYLEQLIKSINDTICKTRKDEKDPDRIRIELDAILAHNQYKDIPIYDEISRYAGSNNIHDRVRALSNIPHSVILAISTTLEEDMDGYSSKIMPCEKISYLVNLDSRINFDNDLLTNLHYGTLNVLKQLFGFEAPNLLDKKNIEGKNRFINNIQNIDISRWKKCAQKESDDDGYNKDDIILRDENHNSKSGINSSLLATDKFVNEFDKLMNMLKKKDEKDSNQTETSANTQKNQNSIKPPSDEIKKERDEIQDANNFKDDHSEEKNKIRLVEKQEESNNSPYDQRKSESKPYNNENNNNKNEPKTEMIFMDILRELKNLRSDITQSSKRRDDPYRQNNYEREIPPARNRYRGNINNRLYEDLKTESVVNMTPQKVGNYQELSPFGFLGKKTDISDLKINTPKKVQIK